MNLVPVDVLFIRDFIEDIRIINQGVERHAIHLEANPTDFGVLNEMRAQFAELNFRSAKLELIPMSESLSEIIKILDRLKSLKVYPAQMSEFILLFADRLSLLCLDIERYHGFEITKFQPLLVATQRILQARPDIIDLSINDAISILSPDLVVLSENNIDDCLFTDMDLKEDVVDLDNTVSDQSYLVSSVNPILTARRELEDYLQDNPVIELLANISDATQSLEVSHTQFVLELTLAINSLAGNPIKIVDLISAILIHDIALAAIPHILNKSGPLTEEEKQIIQKHPTQSKNIVTLINGSTITESIVLDHHERSDGLGYPNGYRSDQISDGGKLLAIVDSFHGMTQSRPYKKYPRSIFRAAAEINACVGTQFDHFWVNHFNQCIRHYWNPKQTIQSMVA